MPGLARFRPAASKPNRIRTDERLVGIDLAREGLLTFQVKPDDGTWSFDGAPVGDGRRVFVAMRHSDVRPGAYVACFDAATGRRLWRTLLGAADTPAAGRGDEITHNLLTLVGDRIYFNTNLGLVAALAAEDGRIAWLRRYDRAAGTIAGAGGRCTSTAIRRRASTTAAWCSSPRPTRRTCLPSMPTPARPFGPTTSWPTWCICWAWSTAI